MVCEYASGSCIEYSNKRRSLFVFLRNLAVRWIYAQRSRSGLIKTLLKLSPSFNRRPTILNKIKKKIEEKIKGNNFCNGFSQQSLFFPSFLSATSMENPLKRNLCYAITELSGRSIFFFFCHYGFLVGNVSWDLFYWC